METEEKNVYFAKSIALRLTTNFNKERHFAINKTSMEYIYIERERERERE